MRKLGAIFGREDSIIGHQRAIDRTVSSAKRDVLRITGVAFAKLLEAEIKKMGGVGFSERSQMMRATRRFCELAFREDPTRALSSFGSTLMEREMMRFVIKAPIDGGVFEPIKAAVAKRLADLPQDNG
jgi:hypothetical protein